MIIHWKAAELYFSVVLAVYPVGEFYQLIGLGSLRSEKLNTLCDMDNTYVPVQFNPNIKLGQVYNIPSYYFFMYMCMYVPL